MSLWTLLNPGMIDFFSIRHFKRLKKPWAARPDDEDSRVIANSDGL